MDDDFSALDLLSIGGFRLSSGPVEKSTRKKRRFIPHRRKPNAAAKRAITALLPLFGGKMRRPGGLRSLQGWPVPLSWPTKEFTTPDLWGDQGDRPLS